MESGSAMRAGSLTSRPRPAPPEQSRAGQSAIVTQLSAPAYQRRKRCRRTRTHPSDRLGLTRPASMNSNGGPRMPYFSALLLIACSIVFRFSWLIRPRMFPAR
jgi:hypothetical protein